MYDPSQEVLTKGPFRMFVFDAETQELLTYSINSISLPDDKNQLPILEFYFLGLVLKGNQKIRCLFSSDPLPHMIMANRFCSYQSLTRLAMM